MGVPSIADKQFHGRGEGMFMKSLNCGCIAALAVVAIIVGAIVFGGVLTARHAPRAHDTAVPAVSDTSYNVPTHTRRR